MEADILLYSRGRNNGGRYTSAEAGIKRLIYCTSRGRNKEGRYATAEAGINEADILKVKAGINEADICT